MGSGILLLCPLPHPTNVLPSPNLGSEEEVAGPSEARELRSRIGGQGYIRLTEAPTPVHRLKSWLEGPTLRPGSGPQGLPVQPALPQHQPPPPFSSPLLLFRRGGQWTESRLPAGCAGKRLETDPGLPESPRAPRSPSPARGRRLSI